MDHATFNLTDFLDSLGAEYRARGFAVQYQPFVYPCDFLPLPASADVTGTVNVDQDADFILAQQAAAVFLADGTYVPNPNITVEIRPATSQRQLQSNPVNLGNVFGTGERPHLLFKPLVLAARSSMTVRLVDLSATLQYVRLSFEGVKAFLRKA